MKIEITFERYGDKVWQSNPGSRSGMLVDYCEKCHGELEDLGEENLVEDGFTIRLLKRKEKKCKKQ